MRKVKVVFISTFGKEEDYKVSDQNNPEGSRVRFFNDGRGVYNDYNKSLPVEYLEAVIAYRTELYKAEKASSSQPA